MKKFTIFSIITISFFMVSHVFAADVFDKIFEKPHYGWLYFAISDMAEFDGELYIEVQDGKTGFVS